MLGLLVFECFDFFGFPVKCAEARWLLEVSFMDLLLIAVTSDENIAFLSIQDVSFGRAGACTYPADHFGRSGTPWGTIGVAGRRAQNHMFIDFGIIVGSRFNFILGSDGSHSIFPGLFPDHFLHRIVDRNPDTFRMEDVVKVMLSQT